MPACRHPYMRQTEVGCIKKNILSSCLAIKRGGRRRRPWYHEEVPLMVIMQSQSPGQGSRERVSSTVESATPYLLRGAREASFLACLLPSFVKALFSRKISPRKKVEKE